MPVSGNDVELVRVQKNMVFQDFVPSEGPRSGRGLSFMPFLLFTMIRFIKISEVWFGFLAPDRALTAELN